MITTTRGPRTTRTRRPQPALVAIGGAQNPSRAIDAFLKQERAAAARRTREQEALERLRSHLFRLD